VKLRPVHELRGRTYRPRSSESHAFELVKFLAVPGKIWRNWSMDGNNDRVRPDVENLLRQAWSEMTPFRTRDGLPRNCSSF